MYLVKRVGLDTDVTICEKNLLGMTYDMDTTNVVTRIMSTGQDEDGNILYLPELYIASDSDYISAYPQPKWMHMAAREAKEVKDGDSKKSKAQCYAVMRKAVAAEYEKGCDLPTVTLNVDFIACDNTEEFKQYTALNHIYLGMQYP